MAEPGSSRGPAVDVLIVGAGPTGLTLAAQLQSFGVAFRIIDKNADRAHESRALAVQARTVEILETIGVGQELVSRGNPSVRLALQKRGRERVEPRRDLAGAVDRDEHARPSPLGGVRATLTLPAA